MNKIYLPKDQLNQPGSIPQIIKESWEIKVRLNQLSLDEPKIISLTGDHGVGKDLWAEIIQAKHPDYYVVKFADYLRELFRQGGFNSNLIDEMKRTDEKLPENSFVGEPDGLSISVSGKTMREALVYVAEDVIKPKYGEDFFVKKALQTIQDLHDCGKRIIVTDCRFEIEDKALVDFCNANGLMLERIHIPTALPKLVVI